jgi:hypothetical protein
MNKFILVALMGLGIVGVAHGQTAAIDQTFQIYSKATYLDATATDTTAYFSLYDRRAGIAKGLSLQGVSNDTASVIVRYQLKNSTTGLTGSFTLLDTLDNANSGTTYTAVSVGTLTNTDLIKYDLIRFEQNYIAAVAASPGNGTTAGRVLKIFMQLVH